jgi:hypothetical protein
MSKMLQEMSSNLSIIPLHETSGVTTGFIDTSFTEGSEEGGGGFSISDSI